ncbi:MAG: hypothetical protein ACOYXT_29450 [Bacteroidota bacterium]
MDIFNLSPKTLSNGISKYLNKKSDHYANVTTQLDCFIRYDSLPKNAINNHSIPEAKEIVSRIQLLNHDLQQADLSLSSSLYKTEIMDIVDTHWPSYSSDYRSIFNQKINLIEKFARTELLLTSLYSYNENGVGWETLFPIFKSITEKDQLAFDTVSDRYLKTKIEQGLLFGFSKVLLNKNRGRPSPKKTPQSVIDYIVGLYVDPRGFKKKKIQKMVKEDLFLDVSYTTVKRYTSPKEVENLGKISVNGWKWFDNNYVPYLVGRDPTNIGDFWAADGSRLQYVCKDKDGKIKFKRFYFVIDVYSRKVVGAILGDGETGALALGAFQIAIKKTGFLPREIIVDGGTAHKSAEFKKFVKQTSCWKVLWHKATKARNNPAERYVDMFQSRVCNGREFYIGDSIKSRRKRGKPSPEIVAFYRDPENLITEDELDFEFYKMMEDFNEEKF